MPGPLTGLRIIEFAASGPVPFAGMMLSDMGADVIRIDRPASESDIPGVSREKRVMTRNRRSIALDLKRPRSREVVLKLVETADGLIEGWRPGVAERLEIGPDECRAVNPKLVYGRGTGWGQDGPLAQTAGHDINYIGLSGALHAIGRSGSAPTTPLNLLGDFGGGGMMLAYGMVCALYEARASGLGQVVDASIVDGTALLATSRFEAFDQGATSESRGDNLLDTGAPYYDCYACADGRYVALGALEEKFFRAFWSRAKLPHPPPDRRDRTTWPVLRTTLSNLFRQRTRDEWVAHFQDGDYCVSPVLGWSEVATHPHNAARGTIERVAGIDQPAPAPRLDRTPAAIRMPPPATGQHSAALLAELGYDEQDVAEILAR